MGLTIERIKEVLDNCKKYDKCSTKATKNVKMHEKKARENAWVTCNVDEKKAKIEAVLTKMGFTKENGLNGTYWLFHEESDITIKVVLGGWWNDYYGNYSAQYNHYFMKGKQEFHTIRNGEYFYENGIMKKMTSRGVYTGD